MTGTEPQPHTIGTSFGDVQATATGLASVRVESKALTINGVSYTLRGNAYKHASGRWSHFHTAEGYGRIFAHRTDSINREPTEAARAKLTAVIAEVGQTFERRHSDDLKAADAADQTRAIEERKARIRLHHQIADALTTELNRLEKGAHIESRKVDRNGFKASVEFIVPSNGKAVEAVKDAGAER